MTLLYLVAAWSTGIFLASFADSPAQPWIVLGGIVLFLATVTRRQHTWRLMFICAAMFSFGAARLAWANRPLPANHIAHAADTGFVTVSGIVSRDPDIRNNFTNLLIQVETLEVDSGERPSQGLILVQAESYQDYAYGDRVTASGQLLTPPEFDDFSYRDYLARRGIYALIPNARVRIIDHDQGNPAYAAMYSLKARAQSTLDQLLPSPQAPLLSGILLGNENSISDNVRDSFDRTGTSHIIAISGANIIVVIRVLMGMIRPLLGMRRAAVVVFVGIAAYTVFVGADPAVVRAALMGGLALTAAQTGRKTHGLTSLAFAIFIMTLWNPHTLWDIGFQLSVAATAGIVLFGDLFMRGMVTVLERLFARDTARTVSRWLSEPVIVSLTAQLTTTPLILLYFGRFSASAFLANILIVPAQSYIMILGWLATLLGMITPALGQPVAWVVWLPLSYTLEVVRALAAFEWASFAVDFSTQSAWAAYGFLFVMAMLVIQHPEDRAELFSRVRRHVRPVIIISIMLVVCVLVWYLALAQPDGRLHVWFLDIGQGHAVLIETPDGIHILVDGGPNPTRLREAVGDELSLWNRHIDILIVTQPLSSAMGAIPNLLQHYSVGRVLTNGHAQDSDSYYALELALAKHKITPQLVWAGYQLNTSDGVTIDVLNPQHGPAPESDPKEQAMILRVSYGDSSFLLLPNSTDVTEQMVLASGWFVGTTVLEVAANGSAKANSSSFLEAAHPQVAIVTTEAGNRNGLPAPEVVDSLSSITGRPLYRTDKHGTVEIATDGKRLWITAEN